MSKNERTALPQLRFLQFKDSQAWDIDSFGKLIIPVKDRAGTKKHTLMSVTSGVGLIPQIEKFGREIAGNAYSSYYVIKKNDFAYNRSATKQFPEGYISMLTEYEEAALPNSIFTCFRIVDEGCVPKFFDHLFHNNYHGSWLRKYIEVGARAHGSLSVDTKHLWDMPVALPQIEEQQKIADCLSSLDDLIAAEVKKLEALKAHKKGLMQKLFPAEGKTMPEVRFPGFTDAWEQRKAIDVCSISTGKSNTQDRIEDGKYPFYVRSPIIERSHRYLYDEEAVLTVGDGVGTGKVFHYVNGKYDLHQRVYRMFDFNSGVLAKYFYYFFSNHFYQRVMVMTAKTSVDSVRFEMIADMKIAFPSEREQAAITAVFDNLDRLITLHQRKLEFLRVHKKGLMQGLFPSI